MNAVLSAAGGWAVAVAIAAPIIVLFWWARRNAPVGEYQMDYSVGRRSRPPADNTALMPSPAAHGTVDAPVPANPAVLAPPNESAVPQASTVALPANAPLPPEPASVETPVAAAAPLVASPAPVSAVAPIAASPTPAPASPRIVQEAPKPAPAPAATAAPTTAPVTAPELAPKPRPEPVAPAVMEKPAAPAPTPKPEPAAAPVAKATPAPALTSAPKPSASAAAKPEAAPVEAPAPMPAPAAAEPAGEADDFARLYGPDATAIAALNAAGIVTYRQLAGASIDSLKEILSNAGQSSLDPSTWPQQGRFAAGGKWKILDARFKS